MKKITTAICAGIIALPATAILSCSHGDRQETPSGGQNLVFSVASVTRAANYAAEDYFGWDGSPQVKVTVGNRVAFYKYVDGLLVYDQGDEISFPDDGQPLAEVSLAWPAGEMYVIDQSAKTDFIVSDYLVCVLTNLTPAAVIPVGFDHVNYKLTFSCTGEGSARKIAALSVTDGTDIYHAFCSAEIDQAQLMLPAGKSLGGLSGSLTLDDDSVVSFLIATYDAPEPGTLNMNITVTITL